MVSLEESPALLVPSESAQFLRQAEANESMTNDY